jgi:acetyl-CoA C-acetyltransferase
VTIDLARMPVLVGAAVHTSRVAEPAEAPDALDLFELVARAAVADAGRSVLLGRLTNMWLVNSLGLAADPCLEVADRLGLSEIDLRYSSASGSVPQILVHRAAELVLQGQRPVILIAGAEGLATQKRRLRAGVLEGRMRTRSPDEAIRLFPPPDANSDSHPVERAHGLDQATRWYALIETAIAHEEALDPAAHRQRMGQIMERLNAVAASKPDSWFPTRRTAEELTTPGGANRWISYPYTKYLCSVMDVDMAAAVILTDAQTARDLGLSSSDVAYYAGGGEGHDLWIVAQRPRLADSPGIRESAQRALDMAGLGIEDVTALDVYSAFPASVEMSMRSMGISIDDPRTLTLTGGMPFHGGPGSNYVTHALAGTLEHARERGDANVLVEGSGYLITKHAVGIYRSRPPDRLPEPFVNVQPAIDASAVPIPIDARASGAGQIVAYTVPFDREGARWSGIAIVQVGGVRTVALADEELTEILLTSDGVGLPVTVCAGDPLNSVRAS